MQFVSSSRVFWAGNCVGFQFGEKHRWGGYWWRTACAGFVFAVACMCFAQDAPSPAAPLPPTNGSGAQSSAPLDTKRPTNPQTNTKLENAAGARTPEVSSQRPKQVSAESSQLLAMAVALKAEVDKTNKDTLSVAVIRKADEIEKLAKTVKDKMKQHPVAN